MLCVRNLQRHCPFHPHPTIVFGDAATFSVLCIARNFWADFLILQALNQPKLDPVQKLRHQGITFQFSHSNLNKLNGAFREFQ